MSEVSTTSSTFSGDAETYERLMGRWSRRLAGPFIDFVGVQDGDAVLDVGCGTGSLTLAVAARAKVASVTGIDLSETYVAFARGCSDDNRITFDAGDAGALPYPNGAFDRVMSAGAQPRARRHGGGRRDGPRRANWRHGRGGHPQPCGRGLSGRAILVHGARGSRC